MTFETNLREARSAYRRYRDEIHTVFSKYRADLDRAKQEAGEYKDEKGHFEQRRAELIAHAREKVAAADRRLQAAISKEISALRGQIYDYATKPAPRDVMATLRDYKDFGLKPTPAELAALARQTQGNYTALQALGAVAKQAGYAVNVPDVADAEKALRDIESRLQPPLLCADNADLSAALDVLDNQVQRRPDGSVAYQIQRPSAASLVISNARVNGIEGLLNNLEAAWSNKPVPTIDQFKPIKGEDGEQITPAQQRQQAVDKAVEGLDFSPDKTPGEEAAATVAEQIATAEETYQKVMAAYTGHSRSREGGE